MKEGFPTAAKILAQDANLNIAEKKCHCPVSIMSKRS